ncbi:ABC transporter permease [Fulvivirgaceae bacterium BMA10]|uniref:ABC transporter permease n=1 Tax=Splendidivirga corallicola TaxID=3051826 RepID=A0ABT8KVL1_9BACT|nr:ABC transporter permease [Fulvivirgaceae bacterium BMA10]
MTKNNLKLIFRNFLKNKGYVAINILGLTLGTAACLLIYLLVTYELSFDNYHSNTENIYRVVIHEKEATGYEYSPSTPYPLAEALRIDMPDVSAISGIHYDQENTVRIDDKKFKEENILFADSLFSEVFDIPMKVGNAKEVLSQPNSVILTQEIAQKYFPNEDPIGKVIILGNELNLEVKGIVKDPPPNTHLPYIMLVSLPSLTDDFIGGFDRDSWGVQVAGYTYMVVSEHISKEEIEAGFIPFLQKYRGEKAEGESYHLQPLREIHFDTRYAGDDIENAVEYKYLFILSLIGILILVVASINFVNLSTALAVKKSKEVGIRKTLGASRFSLGRQFMLETLLLTLVATIIALALVERLLPSLNNFLNKEITFNLFTDPSVFLFVMVLVIFVSVLSGTYPSFILARYHPIMALKNKITSQNSTSVSLRKWLVIIQFAVSQVLIICTIIISQQMGHFRNKPLGFNSKALLTVPMPENKSQQLDGFKTRLSTNPNIESISYSLGAPSSGNNITTSFRLKGTEDESYSVNVKMIDYSYYETFGLELLAGRWFSPNEEKFASIDLPKEERKYSFVVNEATVKRLGFSSPEDALGKMISTGVNSISAPIIGVVRDFHFKSLHQQIEPCILMHFPYFYYTASLKVSSDHLPETIEHVKSAWSDIYSNYIFEYEFVDDHLAKLYQSEERTFTLFKVFSSLAILISCLGLLGLTSFITLQKTKEVAVRKVFGASISNVVYLFSRDFLKLVGIAFVLALPLAWYGADTWLAGFAYKIDLEIGFFLASVLLTGLIAFVTVSYQSIKAALVNPVDSLRNE